DNLCTYRKAVFFGKRRGQQIHSLLLRYKVPPSFTGTHTTPGSSPLPLIHFDAFISYSKKDEKLIIDTLYRSVSQIAFAVSMVIVIANQNVPMVVIVIMVSHIP
ncbi:hypothetical protein WUBG_11915, partial [Wuchereria bancrofti]